MHVLGHPLVATLAVLALLSAPVGCSGADSGKTAFSLKVVVQPSGQAAAAQCVELGTSSGSTDENNLVPAREIQIASHNTPAEGSWYEVEITGYDGNAHSWRYDEGLARSGAVLDLQYEDGTGQVAVRMSSAFTVIQPCRP
jgi:hypothetical protein